MTCILWGCMLLNPCIRRELLESNHISSIAMEVFQHEILMFCYSSALGFFSWGGVGFFLDPVQTWVRRLQMYFL